jgi:hypothetical protein
MGCWASAEGTARLAHWGFAVAVNYGGAGILDWLPGRDQRVGLGQTDIAASTSSSASGCFLIVLGESVLTAGDRSPTSRSKSSACLRWRSERDP